MSLTIEQVTRSFTGRRPKDVLEALQLCNLPIKYLGSGAFRDAYEIVGVPLVAKFPIAEGRGDFGLAENIAHSRSEMRALKRIQKSARDYVAIHPYLPKVYYYSPHTGVILMHRYTPLGDGEGHEEICEGIDELVRTTLGNTVWANGTDFDCHTDNVGTDEDGNFVIMDLGCFERE